VFGGLMPPDGGDVRFDGRNIAGLRPDQLARLGLVRTFQISRELGELTVLENMLLAAPQQSGESVWRNFLTPARVRAEEAARSRGPRTLLDEVDLWPHANEPAKNLSGGQKKLLEISRALMLDPKLILLDEPTAGVSPLMTKVARRGHRQAARRRAHLCDHRARHGRDRGAVQSDLCAGGGRTLTSGTFKRSRRTAT
jgi:ABC-type branched-subunit amino acid transport system ATPase component